MTPTEAAKLLTICSGFDNRKASIDHASTWALALDGLRVEDCQRAIVEHYSTSREWIMPADIRAAVKRLRSKRIAEAPHPLPPPDLTEAEERAWIADARRRIGDGEVLAEATGRTLEQRSMPELKALITRGPATERTADV